MNSLKRLAWSRQSGQMGCLVALAVASGVGSRVVPRTDLSGGRPVSGSIMIVVTLAWVKPKVRLHA